MFTWYGNSGAHNTVDAQRHMGGALPYGSQWRPQYCRENIDAYNTVYVREVAEYCSYRRTGYGPWYHGLTCAPWLAFSVRPLVPSGRASLVGWPQSALVAPVGEER